jgi:hypothetical protein
MRNEAGLGPATYALDYVVSGDRDQDVYCERKPQEQRGDLDRQLGEQPSSAGEKPVENPAHTAGGVMVPGVGRHCCALQRSGFDAPRGPAMAGTGTGPGASPACCGLAGSAGAAGPIRRRRTVRRAGAGVDRHSAAGGGDASKGRAIEGSCHIRAELSVTSYHQMARRRPLTCTFVHTPWAQAGIDLPR